MAIDIGLRIVQLLDSIGIKGGNYLGKASNVKKAFTGGKPTFFKPDVLETLRAQDGTFTDALKLLEEEAKFIANADDVEKMAFLNNLMEYKSLGGPQKTKSGITALDQAKNLTDEAKNLQTSTEDLMGLAKSMKEDAEKNLAKSKQDLDDFFTTGGQPFKKKDNKFLGGSMHEEGQLRTGIRQFLQTEYKNGRLKLDDLDKERIMQYSPMIEHDPIKVFKKIYGNEAYNKAGSFPGAFEKGENFKHYEKIFRENMGDEILQIKNNEYKGDGKLILTEQEEVFTPTPDDDDIPFAEGGIAGMRQGYFKGLRVSKKVLNALSPKNVRKAVDNIFKTGDYKYDASMAAESFVELNPKLFGGKLYEDLDDATQSEIYGAVLVPIQQDVSMALKIKKASKPNKTLEGIKKTGTIDISDSEVAEEFARFIKETSPGDAEKVEQTVELSNFDTKDRKKNAAGGLAALLGEPQGYYTGGRAGFNGGGTIITLMDGTKVQIPAGSYNSSGGLKDRIYSSSKGDLLREEIVRKLAFAKGGRAGYYTGGMVDVEPNLSDIGHGSDALMARTRLMSPGSQATTSTGLNYLLAEDNDNIRVPFSTGKLAGGIDSAIAQNKALEERIDRNKRMTDMLNKIYEDKTYGKHMTPMPVPMDDVIKLDRPSKPELQVGPYKPSEENIIDLRDNFVPFDDGTVYYKDTGEYYNKDGKQVDGPNKGAKIIPKTLEAAEGGRIGFAAGTNLKKREEEMGPSFETNDPKEAIKEIIQRMINVDPGKIPLSENMQLMFDLNRAQIGGEKNLFGGEVQFGINKGFGRDDMGIGFNFKKEFADGGIAGLRQGYSKGKGVDLTRRGFLKIVAGTVGAVAALKSGALKLLGKSSTKAIPKIVEIGKGSGVPKWFEPMVNKVLADGLDVTKGNAIVDGQVVKRIDTPNGQVDVYHNQRSGEIDVEYASESHAALGDSVHLNYKPGMSMADENVPNPPDEFMASESIPEGRMSGPDDYNVELGENTVDEVGGLFSDTSELEKLGGENINMREILKNIEKKKKLKQMNENPDEFASDNLPDYDPT